MRTEPSPLTALSQRLVDLAAAQKIVLATAESCTGGLIGGAITDIAGSSAVFDRGFITYSNEAKHELLGVERALISRPWRRQQRRRRRDGERRLNTVKR